MSSYLFLFSFFAVPSALMANLVELDSGLKLEGSIQKSRDGRDFYSFTSVPYAKPPLGDLRFKNPQPLDQSAGIVDASGPESPRCTQIYYFVPALRNLTLGQEDCLYLNVFTPKLAHKAGLPVMVYIHGGGWRCGEAGGHSRADYLMDQDVVLVVPSYRLGLLGFLSTEDEAIPGNFGLKDQAMALKWVRENIEHFGGDPNSITIFGESAGGASVHYHLMSPLSKDLIKGGISESGVATSLWAVASPGVARKKSRQVARALGCPEEDHVKMAECFRQIDPKKLTEMEHYYNVIDFDPAIPYQPVIEGKNVPGAFITEDPAKSETHLPWIQGITSAEGALKAGSLLAGNPQDLKTYINELEALLPLGLMYDEKFSKNHEILMTKKIMKRYVTGDKPTIQNIVDIYSHSMFLWPSVLAANNHKGPQWFYYFDHRGQYSFMDMFGLEEDLGVSHADELLYLFDFKDIIPVIKDQNEVDRKISDKMIKLWVDFAKYGNPTPGNAEVKWKQHGSKREYLHMATDVFKMDKGLMEDEYLFWSALPHGDDGKDEL